MLNALDEYKDLLNQLIYVRWLHCGQDSLEEDTLLETMDLAWMKLTESERSHIQAIPSRSFLRTPVDRIQVDLDLAPGPRRMLVDRVEAA